MKAYNIYNPSPARRIIHSGGEVSRAIEIRPRSSVSNVMLADNVAERLIALGNTDKERELQLSLFTEEQKVPAMKMTIDESKIGVLKGKR